MHRVILLFRHDIEFMDSKDKTQAERQQRIIASREDLAAASITQEFKSRGVPVDIVRVTKTDEVLALLSDTKASPQNTVLVAGFKYDDGRDLHQLISALQKAGSFPEKILFCSPRARNEIHGTPSEVEAVIPGDVANIGAKVVYALGVGRGQNAGNEIKPDHAKPAA